MLFDLKILLLFSGQIIALLLLFRVAFDSVLFLQWNSGASDEKQISLERKTYLLNSLLSFALLLNLAVAFWFLHLLNNHFPSLIKGAMCGDGVIRAGKFGEVVFYLKAAIFVLFSVIHHLNEADFRQAKMPFTPSKYIFVFPLLGLNLADFYFGFEFVSSLKPDVVTNCCSAAAFISENAKETPFQAFDKKGYRIVFVFFSILMTAGFYFRHSLIYASLTLGFIASGIFALKYHFAALIYENLSHNCLFDLFISENHYVGYVIFGGYAFLLHRATLLILVFLTRRKEEMLPQKNKKDAILLGIALMLSLSVWLYEFTT